MRRARAAGLESAASDHLDRAGLAGHERLLDVEVDDRPGERAARRLVEPDLADRGHRADDDLVTGQLDLLGQVAWDHAGHRDGNHQQHRQDAEHPSGTLGSRHVHTLHLSKQTLRNGGRQRPREPYHTRSSRTKEIIRPFGQKTKASRRSETHAQAEKTGACRFRARPLNRLHRNAVWLMSFLTQRVRWAPSTGSSSPPRGGIADCQPMRSPVMYTSGRKRQANDEHGRDLEQSSTRTRLVKNAGPRASPSSTNRELGASLVRRLQPARPWSAALVPRRCAGFSLPGPGPPRWCLAGAQASACPALVRRVGASLVRRLQPARPWSAALVPRWCAGCASLPGPGPPRWCLAGAQASACPALVGGSQFPNSRHPTGQKAIASVLSPRWQFPRHPIPDLAGGIREATSRTSTPRACPSS